MPNYIYKGFEFTTSTEKYVASRKSATESVVTENSIRYLNLTPERSSVDLPVTKINECILNYNGAIFRRKSITSITLRIIFINGIDSVIRNEDELGLTIIAPHTTTLVDLKSLIEGDLLEYVSGTITSYKEITLNFNRDIEIAGSSNPVIKSQLLSNLYILDATQVISELLTYFDNILSQPPYELFVNSELDPNDLPAMEAAILSYQEFPNQVIRYWPQYSNDYTPHLLNCKIRILTASTQKFERLLNDYNNLKFLSNINRITIKNKLDEDYILPFKWEVTPGLSDYSTTPVNQEGQVVYELTAPFVVEFHTLRNNQYTVIEEIIKEYELKSSL